jgi:hypothetical protein
LSVPVTEPHVTLRFLQKVGTSSFTQPHTLPAPHVSPDAHAPPRAPQVSVCATPQLSATPVRVPQFFAWNEQTSCGLQQTFGVPGACPHS